ncbi:MAG: universal stress protein UspA [Desulfobacteraceae bacterium IS3]|nr:MAG: universal stress protein UspA [Desulfobacteraceae bacterium IS3]
MKIMLAYDRSTKISEKSLEMAKKHAEAFDAKVYVVTSMIGGRDIPQEDFRLAEKELAYAENLLKAEEIPCEARVLVGGLSPGEALVEFAKEHKIDEIIVGVRKKSRLEKLVLGSTAQYIILNSPCPVLSVV